MKLELDDELMTALRESARRKGVDPEAHAIEALRERFMIEIYGIVPRDDWERGLISAAIDCGVSLSDWDLSSEGLY